MRRFQQQSLCFSPYYSKHHCQKNTTSKLGVISCFRHEVAENCALLGHYAERSGNFLPTFRDSLSESLIPETWGWDR